MNKLKVLHILWSTNTGGIERLVLQLWKVQKQDPALEVTVFAGQPEGSLWHEFVANGTVVKGPFKNGADLSPSKIAWTKGEFKKYDVLHFHSFHPGTAIAAVQSGKRIIYTEHGNFGFGKKVRFSDRIIRRFLRYFLKSYCSYITFNSEFSKKTAVNFYKLKGRRMKVVYNGIPQYTSVAPPDKDILDFSKGHFTVGFIGRITDVKRIDRLIETANMLKGRSDFRLIIIGEGPLLSKIRKLITESGLASNIMLAGKRADVRRFYPIFNAFVLPSANEAFGLVVAEALYAGIPCYVFNDAGGPVELISKHEPANICSNPSEMADELFQLSCRKPDENEIIKRKKTAALFSLQKMEESFKQIYLEV